MSPRRAGGVVAGGLAEVSAGAAVPEGRRRIYVGSYGNGIALATVNPATGLPTLIGTGADTPDPSYVALSPDGRTLYAANELEAGTISAFAVGHGGALRLLGSRSTRGAHPCHLQVHPNGRFVLSANYTSGNVTVHPIGAGGRSKRRAMSLSTPDPAPTRIGKRARMRTRCSPIHTAVSSTRSTSAPTPSSSTDWTVAS